MRQTLLHDDGPVGRDARRRTRSSRATAWPRVKLANTTITATLVAEGPFAGVGRPGRRGTAGHRARALRGQRRHPPDARF